MVVSGFRYNKFQQSNLDFDRVESSLGNDIQQEILLTNSSSLVSASLDDGVPVDHKSLLFSMNFCDLMKIRNPLI